jgi:hypothetical protein
VVVPILNAMKNSITFLALCFFFIACHHKGKELSPNIKKIKISIDEYKQYLDISEFYNAQFIPLETSPESMIGNMDKVIIKDNLIYILDARGAKKIFVFDIKGKFSKTIGKPGKGEGEYLVLADFDILENKIYISSQQNNKMLVFNLNGDHIKDIKFSDYIGTHLKKIKNDGFVVRGADGSNKSAIFYDEKGKVKNKASNPMKEFLYYSNNQLFSDFEGESYMYFALNDTIYKIEDSRLIPEYFIDFGSKKIDIDEIKNHEMLMNYLEKEKYLDINFFVTGHNNHFFKVSNADYVFSVIINKQSKKMNYGNVLTYKGFFLKGPVGYKNGTPILWYDSSYSEEVLDYIKNDTTIFKPKRFMKASINDNPGIVILSEK